MTDTSTWGVDSNHYVRRPGSPPRGRSDSAKTLTADNPVDPGLQVDATGVFWDRTGIPFDRIRRSTTDRARARFQGALPDLIWNAAKFEGNPFTLPEVITLLEGVTIGGQRLDDEKQILALSEAYSALDGLVVNDRFALSKEVADELHGLVAVHEAIESGHFRGEGDVEGGGAVRLSNGGTVEGVAHGDGGSDLVDRFGRTTDYLDTLRDPRERAVAYFAAATRSQFYFDGNKRTARLMMTGELMDNGFEAVSIPYSRRYEFNKALDDLFTTDEATALMAFIVDCA